MRKHNEAPLTQLLTDLTCQSSKNNKVLVYLLGAKCTAKKRVLVRCSTRVVVSRNAPETSDQNHARSVQGFMGGVIDVAHAVATYHAVPLRNAFDSHRLWLWGWALLNPLDSVAPPNVRACADGRML